MIKSVFALYNVQLTTNTKYDDKEHKKERKDYFLCAQITTYNLWGYN